MNVDNEGNLQDIIPEDEDNYIPDESMELDNYEPSPKPNDDKPRRSQRTIKPPERFREEIKVFLLKII